METNAQQPTATPVTALRAPRNQKYRLRYIISCNVHMVRRDACRTRELP